jgi:hypothetical protein
MIHKHSGEEQVPQNKKKKIQKYGSNGTNKATTFDQVSGFLRILRFPPPSKTDRHDITEILLKVALNIITITPLVCSVMRNWN